MFLRREDTKETRQQTKDNDSSDDSSASVDYFADIPSDADGFSDSDASTDKDENEKQYPKSAREVMYEDFFDPPDEGENDEVSEQSSDDAMSEDNELYDTRDVEDDESHKSPSSKLHQQAESDDDDDVQDVSGNQASARKSTFERQQEKLKRRITEFEESNLAEKPWQLKGEAAAEGRPENSLLEEHLLFDHASRQAPVITEETTKKLEDIILQRIKDQAWDDVERKVKPKEEPFEYKRRLVLDHEKSKQSLTEIYEQDFLRKQQKEKTEEEIAEHAEIRQMSARLFSQLDALSHFRYMPKPPVPETKIVNNLPAITVEEVAPVGISDAALLAPEEVKARPKGQVKSTAERTKTDMKRERRRKKLKQKQRRIAKESKGKQDDGKLDGVKKKDALKKLKAAGAIISQVQDTSRKKALKSSKTFFAQLQDQVTNQNHREMAKKKRVKTSTVKLKL